MASFAEIAEARTRDVSELLLEFVEKEYARSDSGAALKWNIKQNAPKGDEIEGDEGDEENGDKESVVKKKTRGGKANLEAILNFLSVFSKVRSPKSMYREPELNKLYTDFLQHKNPDIQKVALDCLTTYKHKFLTPYKDHLYNLIDEKKFKNEITSFRIDKDSDQIQEAHRSDLIPLIMRIVFSKMSLKTGGKAAGQHHRNLVLRFLAGCQDHEMLTFVKMALRHYEPFLENDPEAMVLKLSHIDLEGFIPPKRLQSTLNLLNVILEQFGGLMGTELVTYVLQVILTVGGALNGAFQQSAQLHTGYLPILRSLKNSSVKLLEKVFEKFTRYAWSNKQINAIFRAFVWPNLDRFVSEGIHSPTALLRLFVQWGSNPRYFPLLVKHQEGNSAQFVLPHVISLLLHAKSSASVVIAIEEMVERMLSLLPDDEDLGLVLPVDCLLPIAKHILDRIQLDDTLNYGSCILLPHVAAILEKIQRRLSGKNKNLNQRELFILSRISELVWEEGLSDATLKLLLPVVLKKCTGGEEILLKYLSTIDNLIGNLSNPRGHLRQILPLFGEVTSAPGRRLLVKIIEKLLEAPEAIKMIQGLNANDQRWVDQPDFQRRHDTFKDLHASIEAGTLELEVGVLLIYNCLHLLRNEKDLSLRENSSHCLKVLVPHLLGEFPKDLDYLLNDTVFSLIRTGMKNRDGNFRNEVISLLGHLSRECSSSHFVLRDLHLFTNKQDLEVDFFENLTHLQTHRHARALAKFCNVAKELPQRLNVRTLTQFVLPLASHYLCSEKFVGKNSVVDGAIEIVGTVCRILPWHQYEAVLKFYLGRLRRNVEFQKQLVRLMVAILDAFHFDLGKGYLVEEVLAEVEKKNEEIDKKNEEEEEVDEDVGDAVGFEEENDEDEDEAAEAPETKIALKTTILCKSTASRVIKTIQTNLLPQLHRALGEMTHHDKSHKLNRKRTGAEREEEDLLRVPISLALVKLLQRLPKEILEGNLPGIFMKLCTFLKSPLESVRRVARETLQKIMQTLGPTYLNLLLGEMSPLLSRGFQVHVLVFTTHSVLGCLKDSYAPGDIDKVLLTVLQLCQADLFGSLSEEKEVAKITVKTSEAKSTRSFDTLQILAQYITGTCLMEMLIPIRNVLKTSHSFKTVHKAQECLRHIALGLVDNTFVDVQSLVTFAYGTASESIPELLPLNKKPDAKDAKKQRPDCFIIAKAPVGRSGVRSTNVKTFASTNAHLLVEFGLRLCLTLLKRDKVRGEQYKAFLDPFVVIFKKCLTAKHVKLATLTLQCLGWVMRYDLPSMEEHVSEISAEMFAILHKYASAGLSKGDNFDLVVSAFKTMAVLVRDVKYHSVDTEQLKVLLLYAEQDMHDHDRQATAFNLLKAIIGRKLLVPELHEIMMKVAELSVTSELTHVRAQARAVFHQYLMDYPLGDKFDKLLGFYISQMSYEMQYGRESAIEMIATLISTFPMKVLKTQSGTLFITLGARLVNDDVPECRKKIAECLTSMLNKLTKQDRDPLFDILLLWLKDNKLAHRRLAAQLCGIMIAVEKSSFETRFTKLLPLVLQQFTKPQESHAEEDNEEVQRLKDHHLYQVLQMLLKLCAQCPSFLKRKEVEDFANHAQKLLGYPHDWVRLSASQFLGYVLSATNIEELASLVAMNKPSTSEGYLQREPLEGVKALTLDLCDQLQPGVVKSDLAEQVIKNLVFIARVLQKIPIKSAEKKEKINLLWLTKRMRKIVNQEVVETPGSIVLRTEVFKWVAGVATVLDLVNITPVFSHLLAPLVREMITTEESNAPLRQLAKEVANLLKRKIGMEEYTKILSSLQQTLNVRRAERKRARTQIAVTDPEVFAKKKIKRHERKKDAKKRKVAVLKGKKDFKRRKVVDMDPESEVM